MMKSKILTNIDVDKMIIMFAVNCINFFSSHLAFMI